MWQHVLREVASKFGYRYGTIVVILGFVTTGTSLKAQQFNTDNYVAMPYGMATFCITVGQRNALVLPSFSLARNWEFFIGANLIWDDEDRNAEDHFQTILYAKYMIYENPAKNAGLAVSFGTGGFPGYQQKDQRMGSFRNYYIYTPVTVPLFNNTLSWDLNPGVLTDVNGGVDQDELEWGFTYSTRLAIYKVIPNTAIVGEVYGSVGKISAKLEFNAGLRWEPYDQLNVSLTWGSSTDGSRGPGFQLGVLIYAPKFICKGCRRKAVE